MSRAKRIWHSAFRRLWGTVVLSGALIAAALISGLDALMILAALIAGAPIAVSAWRALRMRLVSIDLLVVVAATGALFLQNHWESAAVTFLFVLGKALERTTLQRTRRALSDLVDGAPQTATVLRAGDDGTEEQVAVEAWELVPGDVVVVRNGEQVPVDGHVVAGTGGVDEATITGESLPAEKAAGSAVYAGTWLRSGMLRVVAERVGGDSALASIIHRVEEAQDDKARTQTFLERFSKYYTPGVLIGALIAGLITRDVELALTLLVIGCPGALVISIPVSIVAGIGRSAMDGVLIKGGEHLETAARVDALVVDKTGTLTHGRPELTDVVALAADVNRDDVLLLAARAETASEHPLADAVIRGATAAGLAVAPVAHAEPVTGLGIRADVDGRTVSVGAAALMADEPDAALLRPFHEQGRTAMFVGVDGRTVGILALADTVRTDAAEAVARLRRRGIEVIMATGDAEAVARGVATELGITAHHAGMMPEDKLDLVRDLQRRGRTVAMLGDGVNDTPALAQADVGVAMGAAGSPAAIETADIALMADDLLRLPYAFGMARRTVRTMRINIAIALITVALLVLGVFLGGVTMSLGMLVHEASVLAVSAIAMLLLRPAREGAASPSRGAAVARERAVASADAIRAEPF